MISNNSNFGYDKYHRKKPIKEFDLNQTMYSLVTSESKDDLVLKATGFMGNDMSYNDLIISADKLAQAFHNIGIKDGENVAILTISMPIVQQSLLSLSKIGATMSWIDLRSKPKDVIRYINSSNCKTIIVFEDMLPLIESIIDETDVKKVVVSSPKDYLSPIVKVLATLKDKKDPKHLYTQEEIDKILFRFRYNDTFTCSFLTSCYTGMRTGEVFALTWDDIDLDEGIISIKHSIYDKAKDIKGRWYLGSTKTISGERLIYISPTLLSALKNYKAKQDYLKQLYGNKYIYYYLEDVKNQYGKVIEKRIVQKTDETKDQITLNLVFTKSDGKFTGTDITKYPFEIIHKELGIEKCRFYDLRGSYATKVLNSGVEIRDVADMLGHRNIETTENYYVSSTDTSRKCATDNFDKMIQSEVINEISEYLVF